LVLLMARSPNKISGTTLLCMLLAEISNSNCPRQRGKGYCDRNSSCSGNSRLGQRKLMKVVSAGTAALQQQLKSISGKENWSSGFTCCHCTAAIMLLVESDNFKQYTVILFTHYTKLC